MRNWRSKLLVQIAVAWFVSLYSLHASQPTIYPFWEVTLERAGKLAFGAPNEFKITVTTKRMPYCNPVMLEIKNEPRSATVVGQSGWSFMADTARMYTTTVSVELDKHDSTFLLFYVRCPQPTKDGKTWGETHRLFLVADEDDVMITDRTPWSLDKPWPNPRDLPRAGFPVPGEFPEDDSLWGILKVEPVALPKHSGPVDLRLSFSPARKPCDSVTMSFRTFGDLQYAGDSIWNLPLTAGVPIDTVVTVVVPDSSRTALYVSLKCGGAVYTEERRFFTVDDTLAYYSVHPWHKEDYPPLFVPEKVLTGLDRLHEMEKTPLSGVTGQFIEVEGKVYTRREGEYKFRVAQPTTDLQSHGKMMQDSLEAIPPTAEYDVEFQICDTTQMNLVKSRVSELVHSRSFEGCELYTSRVMKKILMELAEKGIKFKFDAWDPVKPDAPKKGSKPESSVDESQHHLSPGVSTSSSPMLS